VLNSLFCKKVVYLTYRAYCKLKNSVILTENKYETGGVLLGYRCLNWYYVVDVTVADKNDCVSRNSFCLDGNKHTEYVTEIINGYIIKPVVLGAWHSHTCGTNSFSFQDLETNKRIATLYNGALSMLLTPKTLERDVINVYNIDKKHKQELCKVKVVGKKR